MSSVSLVSKHEHSVCVSDLNDTLQVRADAVVGRVVYQHGFCIGIFFYRFFYVLHRHTKGYAKPFVSPRVYINGHSSAHHKCVDSAAVDVARHYYLFARFAGGEHHSLHSGGGTVDDEKCVLCAESLCRKLLGVLYYACGVTEVIEIFH